MLHPFDRMFYVTFLCHINWCTFPGDWEYIDLSKFPLTFIPSDVNRSSFWSVIIFSLLHLFCTGTLTESEVQKLISSKCNIVWSELKSLLCHRNWVVTDYSLHKCALIIDTVFLPPVPVGCFGFCTYSIGFMLSLLSIHMKHQHINNMLYLLAW